MSEAPDTTPPDEDEPTAGLLAPRRVAIQLVGFVIGVGLLVWCVKTALASGGDAWHRIGDASPWLVAGLAGCSIVSLVVNGTSFWLVARPIRALRL
ncbi:MAG: hypothetical protein GY715_02935, partial [Planctomycetes bacterium]|nr:hypothetical protein [Planctomycetota bacterium]